VALAFHIERTVPEIRVLTQPQDFRVTVDAAERREANDRHDKIAQAMWAQYIEYNEA